MGVPFLVTREVLLEQAGFKLEHVRHAVTRTVEALDASKGEGEPDHRIRLDAADRVFDLADVRKPKESAPSLTANLTIVWDMTANELPPVSARMALSSIASSDSDAFPSSCVIEAGERPPSA